MPAAWPTYEDSFLGRATALSEARALLEAQSLLTLTGAGGIGKTRFAAILGAHHAIHHFLDASGLQTGAALLTATAQLLGIESAPEPLPIAIAGALTTESCLVLDNLEQIVDAAAAVSALRRACPGVYLLCTSRGPLGVESEQIFALPPLALEAERSDGAVQLFVDRAQRRRPRWAPNSEERALIARLCVALEGLPLAIELVAAHSHTLPLSALLTRFETRQPLALRDSNRIARHGDLAAVIDWSLQLLGEPERRALEALTLLETGFDLEFARVYLGQLDLPVSALIGLVQQSLVALDNDRYRLLMTVKTVVTARLEVTHAVWEAYVVATEARLQRLSDATTGLDRSEKMRHSRAFEPDWPHVVAAVRWALNQGRTAVALRALDHLIPLLHRSHQLQVMVEWFDAVLTNMDLEPTRRLGLIADLSNTLGLLYDPRVTEVCEQGMALAQSLGNNDHEFSFLDNLGSQALANGDLETASRYYEACVALAASVKHPQVAFMIGTSNLAFLRRRQGRLGEALEWALRSLAGTPEHEVVALCFVEAELALLYTLLSQPTEALPHLLRSLELAWEFAIEENVHFNLDTLLRLLANRAPPQLLTRLIGARRGLTEQNGPDYQLDADLESQLEAGMARLPEAERRDLLAQGRTMDLEGLIRAGLEMVERDLRPLTPLLTPRERDLLHHLSLGASNKDIARALDVSPTTVRNRLSELFRKLEVRNRTEAIRVVAQRQAAASKKQA